MCVRNIQGYIKNSLTRISVNAFNMTAGHTGGLIFVWDDVIMKALIK